MTYQIKKPKSNRCTCIVVQYNELVKQYNKDRAMEIPVLSTNNDEVGVNFVEDTDSTIGYSIAVEDVFNSDGTVVEYIDVYGTKFRLEVR